MKKVYITSVLTLFTGLMSFCTYAYDYKVDGIYYNILSVKDRTAEVTNNGTTNGSSYAGKIVIPARFILQDAGLTFDVVKIGDNAFMHCKDVTSMSLPETIQEIGSKAFYDCVLMKNVNTPKKLEVIGASAFQYCTDLKGFELTSTIKDIGNSAFAECKSLTEVVLPGTIEKIGTGLFRNCTSITTVTISDPIECIVPQTFSGCKKLTTVQLPKTLTEIDKSAFQGCTSLTEIDCSAVLRVGSNAFKDCTSLQRIKFPDMMKGIGESAFAGCKGLVSFEVADGILDVYQGTFRNCTSLERITMGKSVKRIGNNAFEGCIALKNVESYALTPPVGASFSTSNYLTATLHVVSGCKEIYSNAAGWRDFLRIKDDLSQRENSESAKKVYFKNDDKYNWTGIYVFAWNNDHTMSWSWPGEKMLEYEDAGSPMWVYVFDAIPDYVVFNNGIEKTSDLMFVNNGIYSQSGFLGVMDSSSLEDVADISQKLDITVAEGKIIVTSDCDMNLPLVNILGLSEIISIKHGVNVIDNLASGVYIIGNKKVLL